MTPEPPGRPRQAPSARLARAFGAIGTRHRRHRHRPTAIYHRLMPGSPARCPRPRRVPDLPAAAVTDRLTPPAPSGRTRVAPPRPGRTPATAPAGDGGGGGGGGGRWSPPSTVRRVSQSPLARTIARHPVAAMAGLLTLVVAAFSGLWLRGSLTLDGPGTTLYVKLATDYLGSIGRVPYWMPEMWARRAGVGPGPVASRPAPGADGVGLRRRRCRSRSPSSPSRSSAGWGPTSWPGPSGAAPRPAWSPPWSTPCTPSSSPTAP